ASPTIEGCLMSARSRREALIVGARQWDPAPGATMTWTPVDGTWQILPDTTKVAQPPGTTMLSDLIDNGYSFVFKADDGKSALRGTWKCWPDTIDPRGPKGQ